MVENGSLQDVTGPHHRARGEVSLEGPRNLDGLRKIDGNKKAVRIQELTYPLAKDAVGEKRLSIDVSATRQVGNEVKTDTKNTDKLLVIVDDDGQTHMSVIQERSGISTQFSVDFPDAARDARQGFKDTEDMLTLLEKNLSIITGPVA